VAAKPSPSLIHPWADPAAGAWARLPGHCTLTGLGCTLPHMITIFTRTTALCAAIIAGPALAQDYRVDPKKVVDGDTFYVSVRVVGADTPEIGGNAKCDKERAWGERASRRTAELLKQGLVSLHIQGVDRYDRLLAKVILPDGRDLAEVLISERLAVPYAGGTKQDWCR
jgi:micrococcal nuclease